MATIVYLDAEDEITSAAARIRGAAAGRVGLVLPYGSRVATSRINFRLLAREAASSGRRLDIVAPDASTRALAASAGLAVFGSVGEYEGALDDDEDAQGGEDGDGRELAAPGLASTTAPVLTAADGPRPRGAASASTVVPPAQPASAPYAGPRSRAPAPITEPASRDYAAPGIAGARRSPADTREERRTGRIGARGIGGLLVLVLAVGAAAVAAFLLLPAADITVTPRVATIGPISFSVRADPAATAVDAAAGVIPATTVRIPVSSDGEFPATGKRVEKTKAHGTVRLTNCDPTAAYTIPSGTVVRTNGGTGFATDEQAFLSVASISASLQLRCTSTAVSVTAVEAGPDGNVGAGTIRVVPARYNRTVVRVSNPAATTGGKREEFTKIVQKDIDAAVAQLGKDLAAEFQAALADPPGVPAGTTVFPDTGVLGPATPSVDPATLVDQEVESFTLSMTATGTVQAADGSPVKQIAEGRLRASIDPGSEIVPGSTHVEVGEGSVVDGVITFPVDGSAQEVHPVDAATLQARILGRTKADAERELAPYGDVAIHLWPDWVGSVPSLAARVTLTVADPVATATNPPSATATPSPTRQPSSATPDASPSDGTEPTPDPSDAGDGASDEPLPSG
jgi:Baseplate J-like protein